MNGQFLDIGFIDIKSCVKVCILSNGVTFALSAIGVWLQTQMYCTSMVMLTNKLLITSRQVSTNKCLKEESFHHVTFYC